MKRAALIFLLLPLNSCGMLDFVSNANEFKGGGRLELTAPISWIPGFDSVLPKIVLDLKAGFEWHNDDELHRHEMEKLRLMHQIQELKKNEPTIEELFLRAFDKPPAAAK